jgi:hypothetical protein
MADDLTPLTTTQITLGEVYRLVKEQSRDVAEIKADVKAQTGSVADLSTRVALLEDRGNRDNAARVSGVGGAVAAIAGLVWHYFKG